MRETQTGEKDADLIISHSIANICRRFSVTFGIEMSLYFVMMVLTGMMG